MKSLSRREFAALARKSLAAAPVAVAVLAQTPAPPPDADPVKAVREANQRNTETLAKFEIPIAAEPAFVFKA